MVAKEGSVDDHNERFSKSQHFKTCSSSSMGDHKVRTFHILNIDLDLILAILTDTSANEGL